MLNRPRNGRWVVFLFCLLFSSACSLNPGTQSPFTKQRIEVPADQVEVIDGDTIKVKINGRKETVRFLLVDTPELHHERYGKQPLSEEAKRFTAQMIHSGKTVVLEKDVDERDKYGRLLAYVYVDGKSVQEALLKQGLARVAYVFVPNVKYVDQYRAIQEEAQRKGIGIWQWENYAQEDGFYKEEVKTQKQNK